MYNRGVGEGKIPVLAALSRAALQAALDADVCNCNPSSSRSTGLARVSRIVFSSPDLMMPTKILTRV